MDTKLECGQARIPDGIWMTKAELAAARGVSIETANRIIRRRRWERQSGVDGRTRILVPRHWSEAGSPAREHIARASGTKNSEPAADRWPAVVAALQEEIAGLRAEIEAAQDARRQADLQRDEERRAREAAEHALDEAHRQAEAAARAAEGLRQAKENQTAEERAEEVSREVTAAQLRRLTEAMAARRSLGLWARLRLAWRGE